MTRPTGRIRPTRLPGIAAILSAAAVVVSACGISLDSAPRTIDTTVSTTTTPATAPAGDQTAILYYVLDESLIPVPARVPDDQISTLIGELLKPLPKEVPESPIRSAIPPGTKLRSATQRGTVLVVDLSKEFGNVVGPSRQKAIAQVVLSATQLDRIREVRFRSDGEDIQVPSPTRGDVSTVGACDFKDLLATVEQATSAEVRSESLVPLVFRRDKLTRVCGN